MPKSNERQYLTPSWWILDVGWKERKDVGEGMCKGAEEVSEE
jgi:hypothetical protein